MFLTYPFVDAVVGNNPPVARNLHMGDYTNLSVELDIDLRQRCRACPACPTGRARRSPVLDRGLHAAAKLAARSCPACPPGCH